ncbi:hypothetical protein [Limnospira platensis]
MPEQSNLVNQALNVSSYTINFPGVDPFPIDVVDCFLGTALAIYLK